MNKPYIVIAQALALLEFGLYAEAEALLRQVRKPGTTRDGKTFISRTLQQYIKELSSASTVSTARK